MMRVREECRLYSLFVDNFTSFYKERSGDSSWDKRYSKTDIGIVLEWDRIILNMGCSNEYPIHDNFYKIPHPFEKYKMIFIPDDLGMKILVLGGLA